MRILSHRTAKSYNKRHRIVHGGSLWSTILNLGKQFVGSQTGKKLLSSAGQYALKEGPGLLGKAWDWIKTKLGIKKPAPPPQESKPGPTIEELPDEPISSTTKSISDIDRRMVGLGMQKVPPKYALQLGYVNHKTAIPANLPAETIIAAPNVMESQRKQFMRSVDEGSGLSLPGTNLQPAKAGRGRKKVGGSVMEHLNAENAAFLKAVAKRGSGLQKY